METLIISAAFLVFLFGLVSALADRTPITGPMVFVSVGMILGPMGLGLFDEKMDSKLVLFYCSHNNVFNLYETVQM